MSRFDARYSKVCQKCESVYYKPKNKGFAIWEKRKFCSKLCSLPHETPWNKGKTKETDVRVQAISDRMSLSQKGRIPWNKGLTKESHQSMMVISKKVSNAQKGKKPNPKQLEALKNGRYQCKGFKKEDCEILAKRGRSVSVALSGRTNPEHSERMKHYYKNNPEKHPNAILAKKTKGHGYTYIESLMAEYLSEMGINAKFNYKIGTKWVDFAMPRKRIAIEADGEYWHNDKDKELARDKYLGKKGWRVLHFSGSEIVKDATACKNRIKGFLNE